jgi:solute carrier family 25 (mitochondrial carnitine/acylcarnitine transporter), member 20/29
LSAVIQQVEYGRTSGFLSFLRGRVAAQGVAYLYRGFVPALGGSIFFNGIMFGTYETVKKAIAHSAGVSPDALSPLGYVAAGAATGAVEAVFYTPLELVKCRQQTLSGYMSTSACVQHVVRAEGAVGLFRGFLPTLGRECVGNVSYFAAYEFFKRVLPVESPTGRTLIAGGFAGMAYWSMCYPFDIVKSRLQCDSLVAPSYSSVMDCARKTMREFGVRGMYRGLSFALFRSFPINAVTFGGYELAMKLLPS